MMTGEELARLALEARKLAYAPYSGFQVGAALLAEDGRVFTGCNIENASFSAGVCAERTALFKAVSEGARRFKAIAVAGGRAGEARFGFCPPCGICRQALAEFCGGDFTVFLTDSEGRVQAQTLSGLLPLAFDLEKGR